VRPRLSAIAHIRALPRSWQLGVAGASVALVAGCFVRFGLSAQALVGAILAVALVLLTAIDLDCRLLPTRSSSHPCRRSDPPALFSPTAPNGYRSAGAALFFFIPMLVYPVGMGWAMSFQRCLERR
jgi:hypothetical protein